MDIAFHHFDPEHGIRIAFEDTSGDGSWSLRKEIYADYDAAAGAWFVNFLITETDASDDPELPFEEFRTETEGPFTREEFDRFLANMKMDIDPALVERLIGTRLISPKPRRQSTVERDGIADVF